MHHMMGLGSGNDSAGPSTASTLRKGPKSVCGILEGKRCSVSELPAEE